MTDQTTHEAELAQSAHRATHEALAKYAAGLQGMNPDAIGRVLLGAAATTVAVALGRPYTATLLRELADRLLDGRQDLN